MKILTIRFANLNSLAGEWCIDFTSAEYVASGIFAIVGTTGSGKSTILDAISLALYGRTPRLKQISKSGNEIMSRHTGYCFAEVEFISVRGRFRSHWSQHRARRSPSGDLQQPRHEIVDGAEDRVLASKIKDVGILVNEVTGMNFDQFTRSMLLAQGDFSKFLQAGSDDRAPILEQITGTEIYSRISQQVHLQKNEEEAQLKTLQEEIAATNLMSASEEDECRKVLQQLTREAGGLQDKLTHTSNCMNWQKMLQHLTDSVAIRVQALEAAQLRWLEAAPQREKLRRGQAAQLFAGQHKQLTELKSVQQEELAAADKTVKERDASMLLLQEARDKLTGCKEHLARVTEKKVKYDKIISEVNHLDLLCEKLEQQVNELHHSIEDDDRKLAVLEKEGEALTKNAHDSRKQQLKLEEYFKVHEQEADLVENLAGIREQIDAFSRITQKTANLQKQHLQLTADLQTSKDKATEEKKEVDKATALVTQLKISLENLDSELVQWTDKDLPQLYRLSEQQAQKASAVNGAIKTVSRLEAHTKITTELEREITATTRRLETVQSEYSGVNEKLRLLQDNVLKQEEIVFFATKVEAYEKERTKLRAGTACPLCGSTTHPFSDSKTILPDKARQQLDADRKRLGQCDEQRNKLQTELKLLNHTLRLCLKKKQDNEAEQVQLIKEQDSHCKLLEIEGEMPRSVLDEMAATTAFDYKKTQEIIRHVEMITQTITSNKQKLDEAVQTHSSSEKSLQQAQFELQKISEQRTELRRQEDRLKKEQESTLLLINERIACYNTDQLTPSTVNAVVAQLEDKRDRWKKNTAILQELEKSRQALQASLDRTQLSISHLSTDKNKKNANLLPLKKELVSLRKRRFELFGDKDPAQKSRLLQAEAEMADQKLQQGRAAVGQLEKTVSMLTERASNLAITTGKRAKRIALGEGLFSGKLVEAGFESTADFLAALMDTDELNRIQLSLEELMQQKTAALALLRSTQATLQIEQQKKLTALSLEVLETEQAELNIKLSEIQQKLGAEKNRLSLQKKIKRDLGSKKEHLRLQQAEFGHWAKLHDLIGSADGKKFRNFAQGLTFELMVVHANRSLARMSERYLLIRHPDHPLELNVIDNYQAGEIRSTANLSGGESFIISLALALGLASMAGKNIQVNSLFLDEGFGTLDEESLEIALETLSCLQQEGKIIGIISHVPLLKERISVQLRLTASSTGRSQIQGPGVVHLQ